MTLINLGLRLDSSIQRGYSRIQRVYSPFRGVYSRIRGAYSPFQSYNSRIHVFQTITFIKKSPSQN